MGLVNCVIRPITQDDRCFLREMLYQAIHVAAGAEPPPRDILLRPELRRYAENWGRTHDLGFVAVDSLMSASIGAAWLRLLVGAEKGYGYVDDATPELTVAVVPEYRGQGIGTQLLSELLATARAHYQSVSLSVSPDNPALRLYQRVGFETVGTCGTSLVMKCRLAHLSNLKTVTPAGNSGAEVEIRS